MLSWPEWGHASLVFTIYKCLFGTWSNKMSIQEDPWSKSLLAILRGHHCGVRRRSTQSFDLQFAGGASARSGNFHSPARAAELTFRQSIATCRLKFGVVWYSNLLYPFSCFFWRLSTGPAPWVQNQYAELFQRRVWNPAGIAGQSTSRINVTVGDKIDE